MTDTFSKEKRSEIMSANRGKGNKSTEWKLRARLISAGISGWNVTTKDVLGKPDFLFREKKLTIFVDGCFWHGCEQCRSIPTSNVEFWETKIGKTQNRDQYVTRSLEQEGWIVLRFWEHELREDPREVMSRIMKALE